MLGVLHMGNRYICMNTKSGVRLVCGLENSIALGEVVATWFGMAVLEKVT